MSLSENHIVNVTSRNITAIRSKYPDVVRGDFNITSEEILEFKVAKVKLKFKCDVCGCEYERVSCKVQSRPRRAEICQTCYRSEQHKLYLETAEGKDMVKRRGETISESQKYRSGRNVAAEKYKLWLTTTDGIDFLDRLSNDIKSSGRFTKYGPENPRWNPDKVGYREYVRMCRRYTTRNADAYSTWDNFDKIGKSGVDGAYQLDHIIPIKYGFDNNICPSLIGSLVNLQIIPWVDNIKKSCNVALDATQQTILNEFTKGVPRGTD